MLKGPKRSFIVLGLESCSKNVRNVAKKFRKQNLLQSKQKMLQRRQKMCEQIFLQGEQKMFADENCAFSGRRRASVLRRLLQPLGRKDRVRYARFYSHFSILKLTKQFHNGTKNVRNGTKNVRNGTKMFLKQNYGIEMPCMAVYGRVWPCMAVYDINQS